MKIDKIHYPYSITTVSIADGKYSFVMNSDGTINRILRHGEYWPVGDDLKHMGMVLALVEAVQELIEGEK